MQGTQSWNRADIPVSFLTPVSFRASRVMQHLLVCVADHSGKGCTTGADPRGTSVSQRPAQGRGLTPAIRPEPGAKPSEGHQAGPLIGDLVANSSRPERAPNSKPRKRKTLVRGGTRVGDFWGFWLRGPEPTETCRFFEQPPKQYFCAVGVSFQP